MAWEEVLKSLWHRGLRRVLLFITDGLVGFQQAIQRVYPGAEWQRCVVHMICSSLSQVRVQDRGAVPSIYAGCTRQKALEGLEQLRRTWGPRYPRLVSGWWGESAALLRFYSDPKVLCPYLRSTNLMG